MIKYLVAFTAGFGLTFGCGIAGIEREENMSSELFQGDPRLKNIAPSGGWSLTGTLTTGQTANAKKLTMQCNFPEAGAYTIQFSLTIPTLGSARPPVCRAEVLWNVEGNSITRVFDVKDGTSITGVAQGARITLYDATPTSGIFVATDYVANAQIAKGPRVNNGIPVTYDLGTDVGLLAAAGTVVVDIPQNIGANGVYVSVYADGPVVIPNNSVRVQQRAGINSYRSYDPQVFQWVPLSPGVDKIAITNSLAAADLRYKISLSIDG